jgi:hypothetical protein
MNQVVHSLAMEAQALAALASDQGGTQFTPSQRFVGTLLEALANATAILQVSPRFHVYWIFITRSSCATLDSSSSVIA